MDNLGSLTGQLPSAKKRAVKGPSAQLVSEFKTAATAVAKLFNLSASRLNDSYEQGYVTALRAVLDALDEDPALDAKSWVLSQLVELTDTQKDEEEDNNNNRRQFSESMFAYESSDDDQLPGEKRHRQGLGESKRVRESRELRGELRSDLRSDLRGDLRDPRPSQH